jgi:hypothetical protein
MKQCPYCHHSLEIDELLEVKKHPVGCVCDPRDWGSNEIPEICHYFEQFNDQEPDICKYCQHCLECHS